MLFVTLGNSVTLICVQYFSLVITKKNIHLHYEDFEN